MRTGTQTTLAVIDASLPNDVAEAIACATSRAENYRVSMDEEGADLLRLATPLRCDVNKDALKGDPSTPQGAVVDEFTTPNNLTSNKPFHIARGADSVAGLKAWRRLH